MIPPEEKESITTLNIKSDIVKKTNQEIIVYSEESHLQIANEKIRPLYFELKDSIQSLDNNINVNPKKTYIAFTHKTFIYMSIKKNYLNLHILVGKLGLNDPLNLSKEITSESHGLRREYEIILDKTNDLEYVLS